MTNSLPQKTLQKEAWLIQLSQTIDSMEELLQKLDLTEFAQSLPTQSHFPLRVPRQFAAKMRKGDIDDPLLLQVLLQIKEEIITPSYFNDPLTEQSVTTSGLLHKYQNRALLLVKTGCAINCRYCFRRHFPYQKNAGNKQNWRESLEKLAISPDISEIIFSGGDPLMAKDSELDWLISQLELIPHITTLRIHSRLASVIPERATHFLCERLRRSRFQVVLVTHINHPNEIDNTVIQAMQRYRDANVFLLNQSVLLRGVNNHADTLATLSNRLFQAGILPYYLHLLDRVQGAAHFLVPDDEARAIMQQLLGKTSGYLVPRLTREEPGKNSKTPLDLEISALPKIAKDTF